MQVLISSNLVDSSLPTITLDWVDITAVFPEKEISRLVLITALERYLYNRQSVVLNLFYPISFTADIINTINKNNGYLYSNFKVLEQ